MPISKIIARCSSCDGDGWKKIPFMDKKRPCGTCLGRGEVTKTIYETKRQKQIREFSDGYGKPRRNK